MALKIMPHGRLQEWVADEKGFFTGEGLEYSFVTGGDYGVHQARRDDAGQIRTGAFETFETGRDGANVVFAATQQWTQARELFPEQRFTVAYDEAILSSGASA